MTTTSRIPVDVRNPGQVFACLGLMELASRTLQQVRGRFGWREDRTARSALPELFQMATESDVDPIHFVLDSLRSIRVWPALSEELEAYGPPGVWPQPESDPKTAPAYLDFSEAKLPSGLVISAWSDGSSRESVKLFAGAQEGTSILRDLICGTGKDGGVKQLLEKVLRTQPLDPFGPLVPTRGSFRVDPRGAWTPIGAGYSLNDDKAVIRCTNPLVELLAMLGFEHARCAKQEHHYLYSVWLDWVEIELARTLIGNVASAHHTITLTFELETAGGGKYKNFTFADQV